MRSGSSLNNDDVSNPDPAMPKTTTCDVEGHFQRRFDDGATTDLILIEAIFSSLLPTLLPATHWTTIGEQDTFDWVTINAPDVELTEADVIQS